MKQMYRILHLEASSGWGGQEMRILKEAEGMRALGHMVVLGVAEGGALIPRAAQGGFKVYSLNFKKRRWLKTLRALLRIIKEHQIEIVNTHSSLDAWIGGIAARLAKVPVVRTRHLSTPVRSGLNARILYGKLADFVVTTCGKIVPMLASQSNQARCRSIPTGIDPAKIRFDPSLSCAFRKSYGIAEDDFLVGTACFMRSWKGVNDFLHAANLLRDVPKLKWVVIGGGHEAAYRKEAEELRLGSIVHFTGHLENPFSELHALDAFALLSTANEGVSQAILQAAYLAKPLIATDVGGLGEVCLHRKTGLQVDPFSPDQVAQAVLELKENRDLRQDLGFQGKMLVEEHFTFTQTICKMEEVYQEVLQ